jgi:hypothetical protein
MLNQQTCHPYPDTCFTGAPSHYTSIPTNTTNANYRARMHEVVDRNPDLLLREMQFECVELGQEAADYKSWINKVEYLGAEGWTEYSGEWGSAADAHMGVEMERDELERLVERAMGGHSDVLEGESGLKRLVRWGLNGIQHVDSSQGKEKESVELRGDMGSWEDGAHVHICTECDAWDQEFRGMSECPSVVEKEMKHEYGSEYEEKCVKELRGRIAELGSEIKHLEGNLLTGCDLLHTTNPSEHERTAACNRTFSHNPVSSGRQKGTTCFPDDNTLNPNSSHHSSSKPQQHIPALRGGGCRSSSHSYNSLATEFDRVHTQLLQNACPSPPTAYTQACISVAGILQLRNAHLERQLSEYHEMYASAMQDLQWNVDMCAKLEERLEGVEEEKCRVAIELGFLKRRFAKQDTKETHVDSDGEGKKSEMPRESTDTSCKATEMPVSNPDPKLFIFYPSRSLIVLPSLPALILQFPKGTNLRQIQDLLNRKQELSPCEIMVRKIMIARDAMGIALPESLLDEAVRIGVPEGNEKVDNSVEIATWETVEDYGDGYVKFRPRSAERKEAQPPGTSDVDGRSLDFGEVFGDWEWSDDGGEETSVCSCMLCAEGLTLGLGNTANMYRPPVISVRGGGGDSEYNGSEECCVCRCACDSDSGDADEVEHEDEARNPWAQKRKASEEDWENDLRDEMNRPVWDPNVYSSRPNCVDHHPIAGYSCEDEELVHNDWQKAWDEQTAKEKTDSDKKVQPTIHHNTQPRRLDMPENHDEFDHLDFPSRRTEYDHQKNATAPRKCVALVGESSPSSTPSPYSSHQFYQTLPQKPQTTTPPLFKHATPSFATNKPQKARKMEGTEKPSTRLSKTVYELTGEHQCNSEDKVMEWLENRNVAPSITSDSSSSLATSIHVLSREYGFGGGGGGGGGGRISIVNNPNCTSRTYKARKSNSACRSRLYR